MFRYGTALLLLALATSSGCGFAEFWLPEPKISRCPPGCQCPDCRATSAYGGNNDLAGPSRTYR